MRKSVVKKKITKKELVRFNRKFRVSFLWMMVFYLLVVTFAALIKYNQAFVIAGVISCLIATYKLIKFIIFQSNLEVLTYFPLTLGECEEIGIRNAQDLHEFIKDLLPLGYSFTHEQVQELDNLFYNEDEPRGHRNIFARKSPWKNYSLELDELRDLRLKTNNPIT